MCRLQTTLLADGSDDEDADAWVKKSREMQKQKQDAAKRVSVALESMRLHRACSGELKPLANLK